MDISELVTRVITFREANSEKKKYSWPEAFKASIRKHYKQGLCTKELSKSTGIPHQTIYTWVHQPSKTKKVQKSFKSVDIISSREPIAALQLSWPGHFEVSGLSFEQFRELLRERLL